MPYTEKEKLPTPSGKQPLTFRRKLVLSLVTLTVVLLVAYVLNTGERRNERRDSVRPAHPPYFYEEASFSDAIRQAAKSDKKYPREILGGVIPHHLLPSVIIADLFKNLVRQNPTTVILIGPNHYELGGQAVLSSEAGWQTPFGTVDPEQKLIADLAAQKIVAFDEKVADREHSIGGITAFIKYYLPRAKIVPLMVSGNMKLSEIRRLAAAIAPLIDRKTVVIASTDFSHYQIQKQAEANDQVTLRLMRERKYDQLVDLNSAYVDSPSSIVALLMVMEKKGFADFDLIYHTSSGELLKSPYTETTSYFSFVF